MGKLHLKDPNDLLDQFIAWAFRNHPNGRAKVMPLYAKYKQLMMYGIFGLWTFIISIGTYALFTEGFGWNIILSNAISWVFATYFAFATNRRYVFVAHVKGIYAFVHQLIGFSAGRLITLGIEEAMLYFFIGRLRWPNMPVKFMSQFIVIALNYVFSKLIVFRKSPPAVYDDAKL
ncbi:GtrA family protein [Lachnospiraceae bacterium YH-ros2226]